MSLIVTYQDCRKYYCRSGIFKYCQQFGWDYKKLKREGLPIELMEASQDGLVLKVTNDVRSRGWALQRNKQ